MSSRYISVCVPWCVFISLSYEMWFPPVFSCLFLFGGRRHHQEDSSLPLLFSIHSFLHQKRSSFVSSFFFFFHEIQSVVCCAFLGLHLMMFPESGNRRKKKKKKKSPKEDLMMIWRYGTTLSFSVLMLSDVCYGCMGSSTNHHLMVGREKMSERFLLCLIISFLVFLSLSLFLPYSLLSSLGSSSSRFLKSDPVWSFSQWLVEE